MPGKRSKSHWGRLGAPHAVSRRAASPSPSPERPSRRRILSLSPVSVGVRCGGDRSHHHRAREEGRRGRKHWGEEDETDAERKRGKEASFGISRHASPSSSLDRSSRRRIEGLSPKSGKGEVRSKSRGNHVTVGSGGDRRKSQHSAREEGRRGKRHGGEGEEDKTFTERKRAREAVEGGYDGDMDSGDTEVVRGENLSDEDTKNKKVTTAALRKIEKELEDMVGKNKKGSEANSHRNEDCSSSTGSNPEDGEDKPSDSTGGVKPCVGGAQKLQNLLADRKGEAFGTNNNNLGEALRSLKIEKLSPEKQEKLAGLLETARRLEGEKDLIDQRFKALEAEERQLKIKLGII